MGKEYNESRDYLAFVMDKEHDKETFDWLSKEFGLEIKDGDWVKIVVTPPKKKNKPSKEKK